MESLVAKLSSYNILNNLIPGAVFVFFGKLLNIMPLPIDEMLAPGENRHFEPGENSQFQPGGNRQSVPGGCSQPRFGCGF